MADHCWTCQKNNIAYKRAEKSSTDEQLSLVELQRSHLQQVQNDPFTTVCQTCKSSIHHHFSNTGNVSPPPPNFCQMANSIPIKAHYSFDMTQQVHYPSNPMQPGPIYFLTPSKCSLFGVNCEGLPRQVFYLTDKATESGKVQMQ